MQAAGGRFWLSEKDIVAQIGANDLEHENGRPPGFFDIANGSERAFLYIYPGSHKLELYPELKM